MKRTNILSKLKAQVKLIESLITEGDHWPVDYRRKAIKRIRLATDAKTYSDTKIEQDVDKMMGKFKQSLHDNSDNGYFLPIIRMFIDYAGNDEKKQTEFIDTKMNMLVTTLLLISKDPSLESKFKDDIKNRWSLEDFEKHAAELQAEIAKNDADKLASVGKSDSTDYDVILIESYEELHEKFGGNKTGYKGQSEWCHSNGRSTYDRWTDSGTKQFFVLAKKGWENITPPDPETTNAFDEYGLSLIAILVGIKDGELLNATLRWNHVIEPDKTVPKTSVDKAFLGWGDLSKAVGFNVKNEIDKALKDVQQAMASKKADAEKRIQAKLATITEITEKTFSKEERSVMTSITIPDSVTSISDWAFYKCINLTHITIPDSVTSLGYQAFAGCSGLISVTIPNSVTSIDYSAFINCWNLTSVTIGNGVTNIGDSAFAYCRGLMSIVIPDSVTSIGSMAFEGCDGLISVTIGNNVKSIGSGAFFRCSSLTSITIPDSVTSIGNQAFLGCSGLRSVTIGNSVTIIGFLAFSGCIGLTQVTFEDKTIEEVRSMEEYPWGIRNSKEVIRVADASK